MTIRKRIIEMLEQEGMTLRDISRALGIPEKEAAGHLPHIESSIRAAGKRMIVVPCQCLNCGYRFRDRKRFTRPSRCPACKGERIEDAVFSIR